MSDEQEKQKSVYEMLCHKGIQHKDGDIIYTWEEWQEIAWVAGAEEAELTRLRPLAEAAEKLSAEDITSLVNSIEFTRMRIVSEPITKKLHALAKALEATESKK